MDVKDVSLLREQRSFEDEQNIHMEELIPEQAGLHFWKQYRLVQFNLFYSLLLFHSTLRQGIETIGWMVDFDLPP